MLVLHVVPADDLRGAQTYARSLCDALGDETKKHEALVFYDSPGALAPEHSLGLVRPSGRLRSWDVRVLPKLAAAIRRLDPDVVVSHGSEPLKYLSMVVPRRVPVVYLRIGVDSPQLEQAWRRALYRRIQQRADVVVAVSSEALDDAARLGIRSSTRREIIMNGRDPSRYRPHDGRSNRRPVLVFVGQLEEGKRPDWFCEVVRHVRRASFDVRALIVGDGPLRTRVDELARQVGAETLGHRSDVPELLAAADLLVFPGRPPEGMPGVLIEAGLAGLPAVATKVPGASTVVEHGTTGFLVDVDDLPGLQQRVVQLLSDPQLRARMGVAARRRCAEQFDVHATWDRWRSLFAELGTAAG